MRQGEDEERQEDRGEEEGKGGERRVQSLHLLSCHSFSRSLTLLFHLCTHAVSTEIAFMCPSSVPLSLAPSFFFLLVFDLTLKMAGTHKRPVNSSISRSLTVTHAESIHHKWHAQQALIGWLFWETSSPSALGESDGTSPAPLDYPLTPSVIWKDNSGQTCVGGCVRDSQMDSDWVLKGSFIVSGFEWCLLKLSKRGLECDIQSQKVVYLRYSVVDLLFLFYFWNLH